MRYPVVGIFSLIALRVVAQLSNLPASEFSQTQTSLYAVALVTGFLGLAVALAGAPLDILDIRYEYWEHPKMLIFGAIFMMVMINWQYFQIEEVLNQFPMVPVISVWGYWVPLVIGACAGAIALVVPGYHLWQEGH